MPKNNKPVGEVKIFPVKAAIWRNEVENSERVFYSVTIERTYKDGDEYKSAANFNRDDLLAAAKCLDGAHSWIIRQEAKDHQATSGTE